MCVITKEKYLWLSICFHLLQPSAHNEHARLWEESTRYFAFKVGRRSIDNKFSCLIEVSLNFKYSDHCEKMQYVAMAANGAAVIILNTK